MSNPDISKYIDSHSHLDIPQDEWTKLNLEFDKQVLIDALSREIVHGRIALPMRPLTLDDARESFLNICNYKCNDFFYGEVFSRYEYAYPLSNKYISESTVGNVASDYFQQANRYACDSINAPSPVRTWSNEKFCKSMLGALWTLKYDHVDTNTLRALLSLRKYIASQFRPAVAKSVYEKFNARNVLDFSAGWGDRLVGFCASKDTRSYIGIDPNTSVFEKYPDQYRNYVLWTQLPVKENVMFYNSPAEDVILDNSIVDTVFTSPPYFNIERYCREPTQSVWRYRKLEDWLNKFLYRALDMSWDALKIGGNMLINISDMYSNHTVNHIVDPMCLYIEETLGGKFVEGFGMAMSKRPNSGALKGKKGQFVEPIWHFRK